MPDNAERDILFNKLMEIKFHSYNKTQWANIMLWISWCGTKMWSSLNVCKFWFSTSDILYTYYFQNCVKKLEVAL